MSAHLLTPPVSAFTLIFQRTGKQLPPVVTAKAEQQTAKAPANPAVVQHTLHHTITGHIRLQKTRQLQGLLRKSACMLPAVRTALTRL